MNPLLFEPVFERIQTLQHEARVVRLLYSQISMRFRLAQLLIQCAVWLEPTHIQAVRKTA